MGSRWSLVAPGRGHASRQDTTATVRTGLAFASSPEPMVTAALPALTANLALELAPVRANLIFDGGQQLVAG